MRGTPNAEPAILPSTLPSLAASVAASASAAAAAPPADFWAYLTLGLSCILTEELAPIVGGVAASQGELGAVRVFAAIAVGGWVATALLYALGRWRGRWVRERFPRTRGPMVVMLRAVRRRPWRSALAVRWAVGARILLPVACGAAHLRLPAYLVGSAVSSVLWSAAFVALGFAFGDAAVAALAVVRRYDQWVAVALAVVAAGAWAVYRRRRGAPAGMPGATDEPATDVGKSRIG